LAHPQQALVETVVRAVLAALEARPGAAFESACACHNVLDGCCPDRMSSFALAGVDRFGLRADPSVYPHGVASLIDHTLLKPEASQSDIEKLCAEARQYGFATVCVNPTWVAFCERALRGATARVCTVVGFPLGATLPEVKALETRRVIENGASEVDMVVNIGALKSNLYSLVHEDIEAVTSVCRRMGAISKVIIETALLTDEEKVKAAVLVRAGDADFIKTSTGFASGGATVADVALLRRVVGPDMGVKAAGGVRDLQSAKAMIDAGADRIGASVGVKIVRELTSGPSAAPASGEAPPKY
jgi:deoxyribose-phosphate aldolase